MESLGVMTDGVTMTAVDVAVGSVVGLATDGKTYKRGAQTQDKIFSHNRGSGGLLDSSKAEVYNSGEEVCTVGFTPH